LAAIGVDNGISVVATATGQEESFFQADSFRLRFNSLGNKIMAIGSSQRGIADLTGNRYIKLGDYGKPRASNAGDRLVTGFSVDNGVVVLNAENGETVRIIKGQEIPRFNMAGVSSNGKYFVMSGQNSNSRSRNIHIETYDLESGELKGSMETENSGVNFASILNDGNTVLLGSSRGLAKYDVRRRRLLNVIPPEGMRTKELKKDSSWEVGFDIDGVYLNVHNMAINEQADLVALAENTRITAWRLSTGDFLWRSETEPGNVTEIEITEDGKRVAILKEKGELYVMPIKVKAK
jgi:WD40 repeat protein